MHTAKPISRVLSGTVIPLGAALLLRSSNLPEHSASSVKVFCLVLLRMGFSLLQLVAKRTVRSYRTISPLPELLKRSHRRLCFLFHFPSPYGARPLAGILLYEARTFLSPLVKVGSDCLACRYARRIITHFFGGLIKVDCCSVLPPKRHPAVRQLCLNCFDRYCFAG